MSCYIVVGEWVLGRQELLAGTKVSTLGTIKEIHIIQALFVKIPTW